MIKQSENRFYRSAEIFIVHVPIDKFTHYPAFSPVGLHCQTPTLMLACQTGRHFIPFLCRSLVCPSQGTNPQPITREAVLRYKIRTMVMSRQPLNNIS